MIKDVYQTAVGSGLYDDVLRRDGVYIQTEMDIDDDVDNDRVRVRVSCSDTIRMLPMAR